MCTVVYNMDSIVSHPSLLSVVNYWILFMTTLTLIFIADNIEWQSFYMWHFKSAKSDSLDMRKDDRLTKNGGGHCKKRGPNYEHFFIWYLCNCSCWNTCRSHWNGSLLVCECRISFGKGIIVFTVAMVMVLILVW